MKFSAKQLVSSAAIAVAVSVTLPMGGSAAAQARFPAQCGEERSDYTGEAFKMRPETWVATKVESVQISENDSITVTPVADSGRIVSASGRWGHEAPNFPGTGKTGATIFVTEVVTESGEDNTRTHYKTSFTSVSPVCEDTFDRVTQIKGQVTVKVTKLNADPQELFGAYQADRLL